MTKSQQKQLDRLRRVAGFGYRHETEFNPASKAHAFFAQAVELLAEIEVLREKSEGRGFNHVEERQQAYQVLREDLERIALTARLVERHNWLASGKFQFQSGRSREGLAEIARQFLTDADPIQAEFVAYELPEDFLKQLREHLKVYEELNPTSEMAAQSKSDAVAALNNALARTPEIIELLDVMVVNKYRSQPKVAAEWHAARE